MMHPTHKGYVVNNYTALVNEKGQAQVTLPKGSHFDLEKGQIFGLTGAMAIWNGEPPPWCASVVRVKGATEPWADLPKRAKTVLWCREELPDSLARELDSLSRFFGDACFDLADKWTYPEKWAELKKAGVRDIKGALADEIYNDVNAAEDLLGDQMHNAFYSSGNKDKLNLLWNKAARYVADTLPHIKGLFARLAQGEVCNA